MIDENEKNAMQQNGDIFGLSEEDLMKQIEEAQDATDEDFSGVDSLEALTHEEKEMYPKVASKYSDRYENKGNVLDRAKIITVIIAVFVFFLVFFTYIMPHLKKNKTKTEDLNKVGSKFVPDELTRPYVPPKETIQEAVFVSEPETPVNDDDINKTLADIPFSDEAKNKTPERPVTPSSSTTYSSSTASTRPETHRNPIQKPVTRMKWGDEGITEKPKDNAQNNPYAQFGLPSKDQYLQQQLSQLSHLQGGQTSYQAQNNQSDKQNFFNANTGNAGNFQWNSDYSLFKGSVIQAVLETGINSDLPGVVIARVTKNVFSSLNGKYMLIPAGSRVFALYNSSITVGQNRVQLAWNTLIRPDGFEYDLGNFTGVDLQGYTGVKGFVTENFFEYAKAMGIISAFSILNNELDNSLKQFQNNSYVDSLVDENRQVINKLSGKLIDRALDIQPTIRVSQGTVVNIITNRTLDFPPAEVYEVTEKYQRR